LGQPLQEIEGSAVVDALHEHQHAFDLLDPGAPLGYFGHLRGDDVLTRSVGHRSDVDVEAVSAYHHTAVITELITDHDDVVNLALGIENGMAGPERPVS
jgi:hypothetical protein